MKLITMHPREIDTILAGLYAKIEPLRAEAARLRQSLADPKLPAWRREQNEKRRSEVRAADERLTTEALPYEREYARRRWSRYFLVTNGNGHVHRERNCSTCYPTTSYAWLVDLAGCDEKAMVAEYGEKACTVCFPDAPVLARTFGPSRTAREAAEKKAARAARSAEIAAKREANDITTVEPRLLDAYGSKLYTVTEAKRGLVRALEILADADFIPNKSLVAAAPAAIERIERALVAKTGEPITTIRAAAERSVARNRK